jgi:hypothetical protein
MQLRGGVAEVSTLEVYEALSLSKFFHMFMQSVVIVYSRLEASKRN